MAGEHRVDIGNYQRLNYFDGLFLKAPDFFVEQDFHIAVRRYLNFLLFKPGRLYTANTIHPLTEADVDELRVTASGTSITIAAGTALVRDAGARVAHEVHLDAPVTLDLTTPAFGFVDGDTIRVTLERGDRDLDSGTGTSVVAGSDRLVEQAVVRLLRTSVPADPPSGNPFVVLANVVFSAAMTDANVTNTTERGGIRLEILSDDVRAMLAGGLGPATLTGIDISPSGPLSLSVGATETLTAIGHFDTAPDRALTEAGDGLAWTSSDPAIASITSGGVVTAVAATGTADITATVGSISETVSVTPVPVTPAPVLLTAIPGIPQAPFSPTAGDEGTLVQIFGRNFSVDSPALPSVEIINAATSAVLNSFTVSSVTAASSGGVAFERIDAVVGAVSQAVPTPGRLRVTTSGGNVVSTSNFTLFP